MTLPDDAGTVLLPLARAAIAERLRVPHRRPPDAPWLDATGASFVTLTQHGRLRGCIGTLNARDALRTDVAHNAVSAAVRDSRFPPLTADELPLTRVEVSVLSAPESIQVLDEEDALAQLRPHIDGVILSAGINRGTFLPQVWEQLPEPRDFLRHLKRKAGLPDDWWSPHASLQRYTVTAWEEES